MAITFECSACGAALRAADHLAGKRCKCTSCAAINVIPGRDEDAAIAAVPSRRSADGPAPAPRKKVKVTRSGSDDAPERGGVGKVLLIGAIVVVLGLGGLAVLGAAGGLWWYFSRSSAPDKGQTATDNKPNDSLPTPPAGEPEDARYFPDNAIVLLQLRYNEMRNSPLYKDVQAQAGQAAVDNVEAELTKNTFVPPADIDRFTITVINNRTAMREGLVVRTKRPLQPAEVLGNVKRSHPNATITERLVAGKTVHEIRERGAADPNWVRAVYIDGQYVVIHNVNVLAAVLERGKPPQFSDALRQAMSRADFHSTVALAYHSQPDAPGGLGVEGAMGSHFAMKGPGTDVRPEHLATTIAVGSDVRATTTLTFKDPAVAVDAKTKLEKNLAKEKGDAAREVPELAQVADFFEFKLTVNGTTVIAEQTVSSASVIKVIRLAASKR